jgi:nucleoside-diphosphate kinase
MEKTLVLIKPDAMQRGIAGEITKRFEEKGLKLIGCKMMTLDEATLKDHYAHLTEKPFFPDIVSFMSSTPVIAQCWEGHNSVEAVRTMVGATNPDEAEPGTIRKDLAQSIQYNVIHASDSTENAKIEIERFFRSNEIFEYSKGPMEDAVEKEEDDMKPVIT